MSKIATVIGATGIQGAVVIKALQQTNAFRIRAITRQPDSEKAQALADQGIDLVRADLDDLDSLKAAFEGSHLVFGVTDFVEPFKTNSSQRTMEIESSYARNIVVAAQATPTLEHFIWSSLPGVRERTGGKFIVDNFDAKNEANKLIRDDPEILAKTTFLVVGWYDINFNVPVFRPILVSSADKYVLIGDWPSDAAVPMVGDVTRNLLPFVKAIINRPHDLRNGSIVFAYIEKIGFEDALKLWASTHGKDAVYVKTDIQTTYRIWPKFGDLGNMTRFMGTYKDGLWSYDENEVQTFQSLEIPREEFMSLQESFKRLEY